MQLFNSLTMYGRCCNTHVKVRVTKQVKDSPTSLLADLETGVQGTKEVGHEMLLVLIYLMLVLIQL